MRAYRIITRLWLSITTLQNACNKIGRTPGLELRDNFRNSSKRSQKLLSLKSEKPKRKTNRMSLLILQSSGDFVLILLQQLLLRPLVERRDRLFGRRRAHRQHRRRISHIGAVEIGGHLSGHVGRIGTLAGGGRSGDRGWAKRGNSNIRE